MDPEQEGGATSGRAEAVDEDRVRGPADEIWGRERRRDGRALDRLRLEVEPDLGAELGRFEAELEPVPDTG